MGDDTLREQVSRAVCAMTTGAERTDAVMQIIREHVDAARYLNAEDHSRLYRLLEDAEAAIERVRELASDDADLRSGVVGMVRVSDIRRALARTEAAQ